MEKIEVTRKLVRGRPKKTTEEMRNEIVKKFNAGESLKEIAKEEGVCTQTIRRVIKNRIEGKE